MEMSHWKNRFMEEQYSSLHSFNITPPSVYCYISHLKETGETNIFQYKCTIRTTYDEFQCSTTSIPQQNLTSDREIKHHI